MRAYLSGKMTGLNGFGFDRFFRAEKTILSDPRFSAVGNPARWDLERLGYTEEVYDDYTAAAAGSWVSTQPFNLKEAAKMDLSFIIDEAEALVLIPGWESSLGANAELKTANWMNLPVFIMSEKLDRVDEFDD